MRFRVELDEALAQRQTHKTGESSKGLGVEYGQEGDNGRRDVDLE